MENQKNTPTGLPLPPSEEIISPVRNPQAEIKHRNETFWQITLPFLIFLVIFLMLIIGVTWAAVGGSGEISRWADVALIWQMPLPIILSLICLVANAGMAFGLFKLIGVLPGFAYKIHSYLLMIQSKVNQISDKSVEPFFRASSLQARLQAGREFFRRR